MLYKTTQLKGADESEINVLAYPYLNVFLDEETRFNKRQRESK